MIGKRFRQRFLPKLLTRLGQCAIRLLLSTCRIEVHGLDAFLKASKKRACVLMLWHDRLALVGPLAWKYAPHLAYAAFVSASRDGKLIHEICESYPHCRVIRVPHDARHLALRKLIQQLRERPEILLITPDGPRGPRHKVKPGLSLAVRSTKTPVVAFTWSASRFWQLRTWDRFLIPKPFSKVVVRFGDPIEPHQGENEALLEQALETLTTQACQDISLNEARWPA